MKTAWDYTDLASAYLKRPDYAESAIDEMLAIAGVKEGDAVCDVGAGVAHLTLHLARKGLKVNAVEPNDAMRANGIKRTVGFSNVTWFEGVGEHTGQVNHTFKLVTFGSSFNVCNRQEALKESQRILVPGGYFACMWNHRDLNDPLQQKIERVIRYYVPDYNYGTRREDQTDVIKASGRFEDIRAFSKSVVHRVSVRDLIIGWHSHGTVHRQAKDCFESIMSDIEKIVREVGEDTVVVPYTTHVWIAKAKVH